MKHGSRLTLSSDDAAPTRDGSSFPLTRYSVVRALGDADVEVRRRAYETLAACYWPPIYKYIRLRWNASREDAEDLTQDFFTQVVEKRSLERYDPRRARFRTFLRTCVDGSVANARKAAARLKRGGGMKHVAMDYAAAETEIADTRPGANGDMDEFFHQEWIRGLFRVAIDRLRLECEREDKRLQFEIFQRYDVRRTQDGVVPTYTDLAREYRLPTTQITNYLAFARRRLRHHLLEALAELTASEQEFAEEARALFGIER